MKMDSCWLMSYGFFLIYTSGFIEQRRNFMMREVFSLFFFFCFGGFFWFWICFGVDSKVGDHWGYNFGRYAAIREVVVSFFLFVRECAAVLIAVVGVGLFCLVFSRKTQMSVGDWELSTYTIWVLGLLLLGGKWSCFLWGVLLEVF
jgi:hypothetical protein